MDRRLVRSTTDKYIAGVCGGLAQFLGVDALFVRIAMVLVALFVQPLGWLLYPALWLVLPTDQGGPSGLTQLKGWLSNQQQR